MKIRNKHEALLSGVALPLALVGLAPAVAAGTPTSTPEGEEDIKHSPEARVTEHDDGVFGPDPAPGYFIPEEQERIYGGKHAVISQRPLLELGRELYVNGPFQPGIDWLGEKNLIWPWFQVFGDWRTAAGTSDGPGGGPPIQRIATQLTLDLDVKLTATERIHAQVRPFQQGNQFTRIELRDSEDGQSDLSLDGNLESLFFEGDLGALQTGFTGNPSTYDLPFAVGFMPLLFQNGVWVEDAFTGLAFTIPARNSPLFQISNFDVTFFAGLDRVTTDANPNVLSEGDVNIFGVTGFLEANTGYWETGYGYVDVDDSNLSYHTLTVAFSKRYFGWLSNSIRAIVNVGQETTSGRGGKNADGVLLLVENSLITSRPSHVVPYANFFVGIDQPQSLARAAAAGGVLKNTGLNFEQDAITAFPALDATGHDAYGGAIGIEYLIDGDLPLDRQIVFEFAAQDDMGRKANIQGPEAAFGIRYQHPISHRFIIRADLIGGLRSGQDNVSGARLEFRWKF